MLYQPTKSSVMSVVTGLSFLSLFFHLIRHFFLSLDPLPCLSPACMRVAEHFSAAMDPFAQPCDYFLFSCKAEMSPKSRARRRGKIMSHNVTRRDELRRRMGRGGGMRMDSGSDTERERDNSSPDRQTALLQAIKEILGMTQTISF